MKINKTIMIISWLLACAFQITPKNKPVYSFTNEYDKPVFCTLTWRSTYFPWTTKSEVTTLREYDKNLAIKAPYSYYELIKITVTPNEELVYDGIEGEDTDFEIKLKATNEDSLDERRIANNKYFIIRASHKDSNVPNQKKIYIMGYRSQTKYAEQIDKDQKIAKNNLIEQQLVKEAKTPARLIPGHQPNPVQRQFNPGMSNSDSNQEFDQPARSSLPFTKPLSSHHPSTVKHTPTREKSSLLPDEE